MKDYHSERLTILIVTYNSAHEISELLGDLISLPEYYPIIVVDNASQDGTPDLISRNFPQVKLIQNSINIGYGRAVNQGYRQCKSEFFLLINPDIRVRDEQMITSHLKFLEKNPKAAATAPLQYKVHQSKKYLNFNWSYLEPKSFDLFMSQLIPLGRKKIDPIRVTYLNAGCLFVRSEAFEHSGMLNEKYFLYGEEPDLFLKFKRCGYSCWLLPDASVIHFRECSLKSLEPKAYLQVKIKGLLNIIDALIVGWTNIFRDAIREIYLFKL